MVIWQLILLPTILQLGPFTITSLGLMVVLGFFFGSFLIWKKEKEEGLDEEKVMDGIFLVGLASLVGGRTGFILLFWKQLKGGLAAWFDFVGQPGFWWLGMVVGGILALRYLSEKNNWDFYKVADFATFGLVLTAAFITLGAFLDGSSYGSVTNLPWGIKFPGLTEPRHPTQLYELVFMFLILKLLYYFDKNYRTYSWYRDKRGEAAAGFLFLSFLALFSLEKMFVGFFKDRGSNWLTAEIFSLLTLLTSLVLIFVRSGLEWEEFFPQKTREKKRVFFTNNKVKKEQKRRRSKKKSYLKTGMEAK